MRRDRRSSKGDVSKPLRRGNDHVTFVQDSTAVRCPRVVTQLSFFRRHPVAFVKLRERRRFLSSFGQRRSAFAREGLFAATPLANRIPKKRHEPRKHETTQS